MSHIGLVHVCQHHGFGTNSGSSLLRNHNASEASEFAQFRTHIQALKVGHRQVYKEVKNSLPFYLVCSLKLYIVHF
jgi:hypothetical protein